MPAFAQISSATVPLVASNMISNSRQAPVPKTSFPNPKNASSTVPTKLGKTKLLKKQEKQEKNQRRIADDMKGAFPSIRERVPNILSSKQRKILLAQSFQHMDAKDQVKYRKMKPKDKTRRKQASKGKDAQGTST